MGRNDDVECHNCGHENSEGARFCSQCGTALPYPCPVCGVLADPDDRFCRNCGNPLSAGAAAAVPEQSVRPTDDLSRYLPEELLAKMRSARDGHAMEGERRTVTMLFADVQGSTSSAERLDPEDWADIMNGLFERLIAPIYRYEGTLAQLRGDAVLAFFGAPIAHEDDPVRAIRAGLEIVEATAGYSETVERRWGLPAHVRVGIHTGLVVVGAMGSDLRVEYTALGDAINVAARMEQTAEPDTLRVTGHTLSLTNGVFEAEELGPIDVKGKTEPVPAFRVIRYLGRGSSSDIGPMVGRGDELAKLDEAMALVVGGSGQIVSVIADAGVGKTRLIEEFGRRADGAADRAFHHDQPGELNWIQAASRSYDSGRPYSTVADLLQRWWFPDNAEPGFQRVGEAVAAEGIDDSDTAAYLGFIAGVPLPETEAGFIESLATQILHTKANQAAISYLRAVVNRRATIVVLEDLHWSDDLSLAVVEEMMSLTESAALGLVFAMRPYRDEASWRLHEVAQRAHPHRYTALALEPFDMAESSALFDSLLQGASIADHAKEGILDRSQGNPLYIEQMVRALGEIGSGDFDESQVPSSLRGLLTARLDRLGEQQRYVVQMASVLGSEFDRVTLSALVADPNLDESLSHLLRAGILVEVPERPDLLGFRHALIQEAAYETILRRTRRQLHRRVADHLIEGNGDSAAIARHLIAADAISDAYPYLVTAGVAATRTMALADAIDLLQAAIENTPDDADPELIVLAHDTLGDAFALIPDLSKAAASYQRLFEYGEDNQRPEAQVAALNRLAYATASIGADLKKAGEYLADARRIAEENNDELGLAEYHMNACFVASMGGQLGEAAAHDEETVRLGEAQGVDAVRLMGMVRRATNYVALLDWERALPAVESALEEAEEAGHEEALATVRLTGSAAAKLAHGDIREALEESTGAVATLDRYGSFFVAIGHNQLASCHYELGEIEEALSQCLDVTRVATALGQPFTAAVGYSGMARVYATAGLVDQVPDLIAEAEDRLSGPIGEFLASSVRADLGFASLLIGHQKAASEQFSKGLAASSTSQFMEKPRLLVGRALAGIDSDDLAAAATDITGAVNFIEAKGLGLYFAQVGYAEGLLSWLSGENEAADRALTKAQEEAMSRGQRLRLIEILRTRAKLATAEGNDAEAAAHQESASSVVSAIASGIADQTLREGFMAKWQGAAGDIAPARRGLESRE
ncbi:MAG TPA: adenylate/guanylate cyclase domain-containing protein [Acidimicrobiia bacterium]|nr:adenylate/guanylate cyclase domain-containing protein [Acidimicrobiia bacterium]